MTPVLAVGGASELAPALRRMFLRGGGDPRALGFGEPEGALVYVHVVAGVPGEEDEELLRRARRSRVPVVAVAVGDRDAAVPSVLATDVVRVPADRPFPLDAVARAVARRLGDDGAPLAARIPVLRAPVCERLIERAARRNALLAIRGAEPAVPPLVRRLAEAHGEEPRLPELAAALAAALGLRALVDAVPESVRLRRLAQAGIAYAGTRAIGEGAKRRFAPATSPVSAAGITRRPGAGVPAGHESL